MKDTFLDVHVALNEASFAQKSDPTGFVVELLREAAEAKCAEVGARLRTDRAPEFHMERGDHRLTGERCLLIASRWAVVAPENVRPER